MREKPVLPAEYVLLVTPYINPRTGEKIQIPASKQPKFKAGKGLKDAIN